MACGERDEVTVYCIMPVSATGDGRRPVTADGATIGLGIVRGALVSGLHDLPTPRPRRCPVLRSLFSSIVPRTSILMLFALAVFPAMADAQWGPGPWGYRHRPDLLTSTLRIDVDPVHADVFVDGYRAGPVDDFDGMFQRLRLRPGGHQIVVFLPGYRTEAFDLYFNPGADQRIRHVMVPLGPGETAEPPPAPAPPEPAVPPGRPGQAYPDKPEPPPPAEPRVRSGTLAVRLQPADAEIWIDGERWTPPAQQEAHAIRLTEGRHRIEVRKSGFVTYTEEVLIRGSRTLALTVTLKAGGSRETIRPPAM